MSLGVRQGEHIGVLMATRPSALTVVAAISRLGAVAVLLRPDGVLTREAELGQVDRVVCDPERAADAFDHPSGLLTTVGGAVAGGARLAMASSFEPDTFWDEVRRYGVTVTTYTWTLVHDLVNAPPHPLEAHHPVRLFIGSGMPSGLWRRVQERFAPAHVLEFYASTEGEAVLANLTGRKIGSKGRPLPGSAEVRIARYDTTAGRLMQGPDGLALMCGRGEVGMLLARAPRDASVATASPLRGVFAVNDAWLATGDLCRRDNDGDFWLVDHISGLVRTANGPVPTVPVEDALMTIPEVDLAAAYGLTSAEGGRELLIVAVTLQTGTKLDIDDVAQAVAGLDAASRPNVVRVVEHIPHTTWYRLLKAPLRAEGLVVSSRANAVWYREAATGQWVKLTASFRKETFW